MAEAAWEALKHGAHDGPCSNADDPDDACDLHVRAGARRSEALLAALADLPPDDKE